LKSADRPTPNEDIRVGAEEIWMAMIGPGGLQAAQAS
jgi:hypothetical protein